MNENEFFELMSNDTRRTLLRSIAQEPKYLFQLSQEIELSQQSLQRHLQCLLEKGWITYDWKAGPKGPARKLYSISKNISVRVTLSQHAFSFDVFEINLDDQETNVKNPKNPVELLIQDLALSIGKALEDKDVDFAQKIQQLDEVLTHLESIETMLLSRKLSITGELNETISMKLDGDAHRKDRELAYTIYSSSSPITVDLIEKEIKTRRTDLLESLKRLQDRNLLPEQGKNLMTKLEAAMNANTK
ncbi:MAG: ArsR family transcriptional regulator [Candidatus Heimdallarchaeota archaeon]|nr:ArsR family transcriptional regulator [Candidatus Heimdallarchaeota archaeon]